MMEEQKALFFSQKPAVNRLSSPAGESLSGYYRHCVPTTSKTYTQNYRYLKRTQRRRSLVPSSVIYFSKGIKFILIATENIIIHR